MKAPQDTARLKLQSVAGGGLTNLGVSASWRRLRSLNPFSANTALTFAVSLALGILGTITGVMAARLLSPLGRGELAAIQTWPVLFGFLAMLGLSDALTYYSACAPERTGTYVSSGMALVLISCGPFMLAAYISMPVLLSAQIALVVAAAREYLLVVPFIALFGLLFNALRGRDDFVGWNALRLAPNISWMAILLTALLISCRSPVKLTQSYLIGFVALVALAMYVVRRRISGSFRPQVTDWWPLLAYGLPCMLTTLPQFLNFRLDQMVMTGFIPPFQLGLYSVAVSWSAASTPLLCALAASFFPEVAAKSIKHERLQTFVRGVRLAALVAIFLGVVLTLATPWGITILFGRTFRAAIPAGLILMPATTIASFNQVLQAGLRGLDRPVAVMQSEMAGLLTTVISLWLMLKPLGIVGAAIASILGYGTVTVVLLLHACLLTGCSAADLLTPTLQDLLGYVNHLRQMVRTLVAPS